MNRKWTAVLAILCLAASAKSAVAGSSQRLGTAGAQELRIPVGARGTALGGAVLATAAGPEAIFWNPAGIANADLGSQAIFSHLEYIADMDVDYFGVTAKTSIGVLGFSANVLSIGDLIVTTEQAPEGTGEIASPHFATLGLSYGRKMTDKVLIGASAFLVNENVLRSRAHGVSFDFGFQYDSGYRGLRFGAVMKNFGPNMRFDGPDFETSLRLPEDDPQAANHIVRLESTAFELPSSVQFGISYPVVNQGQSMLTAQAAFQSNNFSQDEYRGSLEYAWKEDFYLRGGFVGADQDQYLFGPSAGAGVHLPVGAGKVAVDYSFSALVEDFFDDLHQVSIQFGF
jgi:hypothetical protein